MVASEQSYSTTHTQEEISNALARAADEPQASYRDLLTAIRRAEQAQDKEVIFKGYIALAKHSIISNDYDEALLAANQAYVLAVDLNRIKSLHTSLKVLSEVHLLKDLKDESLEYLYRGISLSKQLADTASLSWYLINIPSIELEMGNLSRAMNYCLQGLELFEQCNDSINLAKTLLTLGSIHGELGNYPSARVNVTRAIGIFTYYADSVMLGRSYHSNASIQLAQGHLREAERSVERAISFLDGSNQRYYYRALSLYAEILFSLSNTEKAYSILNEVISSQKSDVSGLSLSYIRLGNIYLNDDVREARNAFNQAIKHSLRVGLTNHIRMAYKGLAQSQGELEQYNEAYTSLFRYIHFTDSLYNLQKVSEATKLEEDFEQRRHESEILFREQELERGRELISQQKQKQLLLYIVIVLFFGVIIFAYREFMQKKKANSLLASQRDELEEQKQIAEMRSKDFTDSLNYAKRIQQAILRASLRLKEFFPESFLFLFPRDIVSGDFYWVTKKNDRILFAIADCTGHGVPGAFMSIIGTFGLNRLVNEHNITNPAEILNRINSLYENSLDQSEGAEIFDGMDIALCCYNSSTKELSYAGANIPLYILREQGLPQPASRISFKTQSHLLYQVTPVKQSIGAHFERVPYVTHSISLMEGDTIYLFSDGYPDQFGGQSGRKFRANELRKLICSLATQSLEHQQEVLTSAFYQWKGDSMQVDDVSFMAIRI